MPAKTTQVAQAEAAIVPGPVAGTRMTEAYARRKARETYFWAWTLENVYNRRLLFKDLKASGRLGGALPAAPPNRITMLTDYIKPSQREVCCPNQDIVYGAGPLALDVEPVVVQVPDLGDRFWVYRSWTCAPTAMQTWGKCTTRSPASTGWRVRTGRAT